MDVEIVTFVIKTDVQMTIMVESKEYIQIRNKLHLLSLLIVSLISSSLTLIQYNKLCRYCMELRLFRYRTLLYQERRLESNDNFVENYDYYNIFHIVDNCF